MSDDAVTEAVRALLDEYREEVASLTESFAARLLEVLEAEEEPEEEPEP